MSLEIYEQYGFKFFPCKIDKTPDTPGSWQDEKNHISYEQAEMLQKTGRMIGAWIPDDVVVLDLDRHEGKPDGVKTFNRIKDEYNLSNVSFQTDTFCVRTMSGGFHVFFYKKDHGLKQGAKEPGIDLKTSAGYVIAAGSPGYTIECDAEPMAMPDNIYQWLLSLQSAETGKEKKEKQEEIKESLLPVSQLKRILKKIPVENFRSNDRWLEFVTSCIAACGDSAEVIDTLDEWSKSDPEYQGDRSVKKRIESLQQQGGITIGTFIRYLQEEGLSNHIIKQVVKFDSLNMTLVEAEKREYDLPFEDPDYQQLSMIPSAEEFYNLQGNTAAASLLAEALRNKVVFVEGEEKRFYYFDGNKWQRMTDIHGIVYTVLYRVMKYKYINGDGDKGKSDKFLAILNALNNTQWKMNTIRELSGKSGIFNDIVKWDSPTIKETITCMDGVIDFSRGTIIARKGLPEEYRKNYIPYSTHEIITATTAKKYDEFLHDIFPNEDTYLSARYASSLCVSGNSYLRIFQIWVGEGSNGKSTWIDMLKKTLGEGKAKNYEVKLLLYDKYDSMGTTPELAHFEGAYAMFGIEVDSGKRFSAGIIKNLTGGDDITINPKYQSEREIKATWQLIFACNDLPSFNANDPALVNRMIIIPFKMRYYKDENDLEEIRRRGVEEKYIKKAGDRDELINSVLSERPGIIKMMIEDYVRLMKEYKGAIPQSEECKKEKRKYLEENDILGEFIRNMCAIEIGNPYYFESLQDLAISYANFAGIKSVSSNFISKEIMKYDNRLEKTVKDVEKDGKKIKARGLKYIKLTNPDNEGNEDNEQAELEDVIPF
jgi:P4 family phage/plasmid primase-like protien